jgi:3-hydroxyisobutyrate dehydrogenase-like beta-hydroxyacid dehydrogenase
VTPSGVIGLLHPGEMGAAVAAGLVTAGETVLWASEGRSESSMRRAAESGLTDTGSVAALAQRCEVIFSIVPPGEALAVARQVEGFTGIYVDANAIAPGTAQAIAQLIGEGGGEYVDGGIVGGPPHQRGDTRLYLSGARAGEIAAWLEPTLFEAVDLGPAPAAASALKAAYAGWTKGMAALLLTMREFAARAGVEQALLDEWSRSIPDLEARWQAARRSADTKGWRWIGEMEQIASALEQVELPGGFHHAAAEVFAWPRQAPLAGD